MSWLCTKSGKWWQLLGSAFATAQYITDMIIQHFDFCAYSTSQQEKVMDLHKIIHSALHEFIQTYITDADLR